LKRPLRYSRKGCNWKVCKRNLNTDDFMRNPVSKRNGKDSRLPEGDVKLAADLHKWVQQNLYWLFIGL
jgi:hypothetical protein